MRERENEILSRLVSEREGSKTGCKVKKRRSLVICGCVSIVWMMKGWVGRTSATII